MIKILFFSKSTDLPLSTSGGTLDRTNTRRDIVTAMSTNNHQHVSCPSDHRSCISSIDVHRGSILKFPVASNTVLGADIFHAMWPPKGEVARQEVKQETVY